MTLFDTSVIIDARDPQSHWHRWAQECIADAVAGDGAAVSTIVRSEASGGAENREDVPMLLGAFGIILVPLPVSAALPAAAAFAVYLARLRADGRTATKRVPLPDFLIGAHAQAENLKLATRDPGRIRTYFPTVKLIVP